MQYIKREDPDYPEKLLPHKGMPKGLYVLGHCPNRHQPAVAIVGARRSSPYGNETARYFAAELTKAGVQVISGMAWGIDGQAHAGALEAGGESYAVLGCGVDICYPEGHRRLYEEMQKRGGILSEQPPGMPPLPKNFPARNRIISGLADLVLVVEAREKSGSLITADFALEQGKDIYAVPGRVNDELSRGCLQLIRQGAGVADTPETILEALKISLKTENRELIEKETKILLAKDENIVYSWIRLQPVSLDELVCKTGLPVSQVLSILVELELKGCIREVQKNEYIKQT
jgi:DNA processing protein